MEPEIKSKLESLEARIKVLETREENITQLLNDNTKVLQKIERAIIGEAISGAKGLVGRMDDAEGDITDLQEFKQKWIYWLSGAAFIGSSVAGIVWFLVTNYVLKAG